MGEVLIAREAIAARAHPDASEMPGGSIAVGTELRLLERAGDWVLVQTPSGDQWWVEEHGLEPVTPRARAPRRYPGLLVGTLLMAAVLAALGVGLLLGTDDSSGPTSVTEPTGASDPLDTIAQVLPSPSASISLPDDPPDTVGATATSVEPNRSWTASLGVDPAPDPVLTGAVVVVPTRDGSAAAFDRMTGGIVWRAVVEPGFDTRAAAISGDDLVVLAAGTEVMAVEPGAGEERWRLAVPGEVTELEAIGADAVVGGVGFVMHLDARSGDVRWVATLSSSSDRRTGDPTAVRITVVDGLLIVGDLTTNAAEVGMWAFDAASGSLRWQVDGVPFALSQTVDADGDVVALGWQEGITAFATSDGRRLWEYPTGRFPSEIEAPGGIIAWDQSNGVLSGVSLLDAVSGAPVWSVDAGVRGLSHDTIVLRTDDGLAGASLATGEVRWELVESIGPVDVVGDRIVTVTMDQRVLIVAVEDGTVLDTRPITEPDFVAWSVTADEAGVLARPEEGGQLVYIAL